METIAYNGLEDQLRNLIKGYYEERVDNTVISIGNAGDRILSRIVSLEVRRVAYHSIIREGDSHGESFSGPKYDGYINAAGSSNVSVNLISHGYTMSSKSMVNNHHEGVVSHHVSGRESEARKATLRSVKEIFENMDKSSSYILVSGFGGEFSQPMHLELARIMRERGLPVLHVIIKPGKSEPKRRKVAEEGISRMNDSGERIVVFDNQKLLGARALRAGLTESVDRINDRIARKIEIFSMKLSAATDLVKYNMIN